jgi:immunity protein Imm1 of predicted polymorphic toxin system
MSSRTTMTAVLTMVADGWEAPRYVERTTVQPAWAEVEQAIRALDGKRHTEVTLDSDNETSIVVRGGAGRYTVFFADPDSDSAIVDHTKATGGARLVLGGQTEVVPTNIIMGLVQALQAVRVFYHHGVMDGDQEWMTGPRWRT